MVAEVLRNPSNWSVKPFGGISSGRRQGVSLVGTMRGPRLSTWRFFLFSYPKNQPSRPYKRNGVQLRFAIKPRYQRQLMLFSASKHLCRPDTPCFPADQLNVV